MMTMQKLEQKLQKADRKQAGLYLLCNFIALMLISAYSAMMFSPTVLTILPEGGDSRKQIVAIFILALFGCVIFTIYAANLFFRKKSQSSASCWRSALPKESSPPDCSGKCWH